MNLFNLKGKVALVTGGTQGIGLAISKTLSAAGATLCINGRSTEKLEACKKEFEAQGTQVYTYAFDVTDETAVDKAITSIEKELGSIDILVNNAGVIKRMPILETSVKDYKQVLDINLNAPLIMAKRVVPGMIAQRSGKIINMCSMMSIYGRNNVSAYAASKGALKLLTENMCCEWAKYNIQINGIGPGYITTDLTGDLNNEGNPFNDLIMTRTPAGRWGDPEDIGNAALFLSSKAANFVNGHVLFVDGGILANFGYVKGENEIL